MGVLAAAVALAFTIGGGTGKPLSSRAYAQRLHAVDAGLRDRMARAGGHLRGKRLASGLHESASALRSAARSLAALAPPQRAAAAHRNLERGLGALASAFDRAAADARSGRAARARRFLRSVPLSGPGRLVRSATAALASLGYDPAAR